MYIPVLKNRTIEMSVIKELIGIGLSKKTIPMMEIIQERTRSNSQKTYIDELSEIFSKNLHEFFLDIPKLNVTLSTAQPIQEFMSQVTRQRDFVFNQLQKCASIPGMIPVISYGAKDSIVLQTVVSDIKKLQAIFGKVAVRISPMQYNKISTISNLPLRSIDYFILDIDDKSHTNPPFKKIYKEIRDHKQNVNFTSFIINNNRPAKLLNKNIVDGEPIEEIDNSLLEMYAMTTYKFDGFGDYACTTNTLPTTGGAISPAGIYYSRDGNFFVGYKGRSFSLSEFNDYIAPAIINSSFWAEYDQNHHEQCPGCKKIQDIANGASGKNQGLWKGITMSHYIYTIDHY